MSLAEYAAPVILLAVVFVLASTRPARYRGAGSAPAVFNSRLGFNYPNLSERFRALCVGHLLDSRGVLC